MNKVTFRRVAGDDHAISGLGMGHPGPRLKGTWVWAALGVVALSGPCAVNGAELHGAIHGPDGKAVDGAMVTLKNDETGIAESVFTDSTGHFVLVTNLRGEFSLRVRKAYVRDLHREVTLGATTAKTLDLRLEAMETAREISDSLPSVFHFGHLPFEEGTLFARHTFQRDCLSCHQLGNAFTRRVMSASGWATFVKKMHAWLGSFDQGLIDKRSEIMAKGFDGKPLKIRPVFPVDPLLAKARITQYPLIEAHTPHDAVVNPVNGLVYTVDQGNDLMLITDLESGITHSVLEPAAGLPQGGEFGPGFLSLVGSRGPHSLAFNPLDGKYYTTDTSANSIGVFDVASEQWEAPHHAPAGSLYPHTIRVDREGIVWFTIGSSDQIGRLDPRSGKMEAITPLPMKPKGMPPIAAPYGIDVHPIDGSIWAAALFADKIIRVDPHTLAVTEFDSPVEGPRRIRFDKQGHLWVAGFSNGEIARIETGHFTSKVYKLPEFAPGYPDGAYALGIDPKRGDVWVNGIAADYIYRFLPREERFVAYPMPLRGTYTRDVTFTEDGQMCTSDNPFPKAALEGGVLDLICIDPEGSTRKPTLVGVRRQAPTPAASVVLRNYRR